MKRILVILCAVLLTAGALLAEHSGNRGPIRPNSLDDYVSNRIHRTGNLWLNVTNYGYWGNGNANETGAFRDPCLPNGWAPAGEYPAGSNQEYTYLATLWVGALIVDQGYETKRVSVGFDGWFDIKELYPGFGEENGIVEHSNIPGKINCLGESVYDPEAVANEEFICSYSDTLTDPFWVAPDYDGTLHRPLGVKITQTSHEWSSQSFGDFIIFDYTFENISSSFLKNLYVGLYVDGDVGLVGELNYHTDDITGFRATDPTTGDTINVAWIADNDGRSPGVISGPLVVPHVAATYILVPPGVGRQFSYNWWVSNGDVTLDYGPSWQSYADRDSMGMGWTSLYGTPMGDEHKYQLLSNGEMDFDQIMLNHIADVPSQNYVNYYNGQTHPEPWSSNNLPNNGPDIANGYDTRYLISWGPLGIFDYVDQTGRPIFRLNPGESFTMSFAYVMGPYFHDPNHPQPGDQPLDSSLFDWSGLMQNIHRVQTLYRYNYAYQPPVQPRDFRPILSLSGGVNLAWTAPVFGSVQGYNVYKISPDTVRTRVNTNFITETSYSVNDLPNGEDWTLQLEAVDDSNYVCGLVDTLVRVGAILPITGLTAELQLPAIHLAWTPTADPSLIIYRILRRSREGDSTSFTSLSPSYNDFTALPGHVYTYWITAQNTYSLLSIPSIPVTITMWSPQNRILVIDETDSANTVDLVNGGVNADSVNAMYERLLGNLGEPHDVIVQPLGSQLAYAFEDIAQYNIVIWHSEDNKRVPNYDFLLHREAVLHEYLISGGRMLRIARNFSSNLVGNNYGRLFPDELQNLLPLTFDSAYCMPWSTSYTSMKFIGANSAHAGFPSFSLDTAKVLALNWHNQHYDYLPGVDLFWPHAPTIPLYRTVLSPADSFGYGDNHPCAVTGYGEIILTFPLYFLHENDAQNILQTSLAYLRSYVNEVPPEPPVLPTSVTLYQNYPNPFNPSTTIQFDLADTGNIELSIFNTLGQKVATLVNEDRAPGAYRVDWNGQDRNHNNVASGVYIYQLKTPHSVQAKKMLLIR